MITNLIIMFICLCHAITDKQIKQAIEEGADDIALLMETLDVATQCGSCFETVVDMVEEHHKQNKKSTTKKGVQIYGKEKPLVEKIA